MTLIDPEIVSLGEIEGEADALYLHPAASTAAICEDKYHFFETMRANGIATIPTSLTPLNQTPFIRKDRTGSAASGFKVYSETTDTETVRQNARDPRYIYQPFCSGRHYCIDAYFSIRDARLIDLCVKEVLAKANGESYLLRSVPRDRFIGMLDAVATVLPMRGIVNFDIYDEDGELKIMEVNCRIGGNYPASHAFGVNLLRPMLTEVCGRHLPSDGVRANYAADQVIAKYIGFSVPSQMLEFGSKC
ncbi:hypothetical protein VH88_01130 [Brevundimonas sp. KM4]|nr:hypothetical protein VH88_01130 [Brevundimonas sp. KM4]